MLTKIVKIGNSKGIRIPKSVIDEIFPNDMANITILKNKIEISPVSNPRENWEQLFKGSEAVSMEFVENDFDRDDWVW